MVSFVTTIPKPFFLYGWIDYLALGQTRTYSNNWLISLNSDSFTEGQKREIAANCLIFIPLHTIFIHFLDLSSDEFP